MKINQGSKKKNRTAAFEERFQKRMQKEYKQVIRERQLEAAIDKCDFPTAARLLTE